MKITIDKSLFLEKMGYAARFTSNKLSSLTTLQGVLIEKEENKIHLYSTNLSSYFHTAIKINEGKESSKNVKVVIEPRKVIEFLSFLPSGKLDIVMEEKQITISLGKTKGIFPVLKADEFPVSPKNSEKEQKIKGDFFTKNLSLILFSSSSDETRPVLTGVNFLSQDEEMVMVATDGFRLSLIKLKKEINIPPMIVPSSFLNEVGRFIKNEDVHFSYLKNEKTISIRVGENDFYSRLIEGDYPPFERVIPTDRRTTVTLDREEFLRNIKLISVFARDFSNIIIVQVTADGVQIKPKVDNKEEGNVAYQEAKVEGEDQRIAFNFKFLLDFLNHINSKQITLGIVRSDAPVVFKIEDSPSFLHIIMPVRIQE